MSLPKHLQQSLDNALRRQNQYESGEYFDVAAFMGRPQVDAQAYKGDIWGIVAPSGGGKTTLMAQIALYMAKAKGFRTLYVSPEVADFSLHRRLLQMLERKNKFEVNSKLNQLYHVHAETLDNIRVHMRPENHNTLEQLLADAAAQATARYDMLIIDHMKLMKWDGDMRTEMEAFCGYIKQFAQTNQLTVWLVNQVPKSAMQSYGRGPKKIEITDVSEASGIYQILDGGLTINTPFGPHHPARVVSMGKGRDANAAGLQDVVFRQNPENFVFEYSSLNQLRESDPTVMQGMTVTGADLNINF